MRQGRVRWVAVLAAVLVLALASVVLAAEFSGSMVMSGQGQGPSMTVKIFLSGKNVRTEVNQPGLRQTMIVNAARKKVWTADPAAKTYWERTLSDKELAEQAEMMKGKLPAQLGAVGTPKRVGTETVNGYACDKMVAQGQGMKATIWLAKKLQFPIKSEVTMGGNVIRQELKNIKVGPQPASLFEVPKGYKKVAAPQMPGGGMQMGQRGGRGGAGRSPQGRMGRRGGR